MSDRKPFDFQLASVDRVVNANEPLHDMGVRIVFDTNMKVVDVQSFSAAIPYAECPQAAATLCNLIGLSMTSGWSKEVRTRLAGAKGCTHLIDILVQLATVAFQAMTVIRKHQSAQLDTQGQPKKINSCYAYREEGAIVQLQWPRWFRSEPD